MRVPGGLPFSRPAMCKGKLARACGQIQVPRIFVVSTTWATKAGSAPYLADDDRSAGRDAGADYFVWGEGQELARSTGGRIELIDVRGGRAQADLDGDKDVELAAPVGKGP